MKFNRKYLLLNCTLFFLLLSSTIVGMAKENETKTITTSSFLPALSYTDHSAIEITSDADFETSDGVTSGTGTEIDPYIIEGWNITVSTGNAITILDTSAFFIVRNNWVTTENSFLSAGIIKYTSSIE